MMLKVFSIFDSKACFFGNPIFHQREQAVVRDFADAVNSPEPNNGFSRHPEDYSLFHVGEFDNESGELIPLIPPKNLVTASALRSILPGVDPVLFSNNGKSDKPIVV